MKARLSARSNAEVTAMTLVEMLVAMGVAGVILAALMALFVSSLRNFAGMGNYAILSNQSRYSLDHMSREMREATQVIDFNTNLPSPYLTLTDGYRGTLITYTWNSAAGVLTCDKTGQPTHTNLTGCTRWVVTLYMRYPSNNWTFYPTNSLSQCKLINMSWTCGRKILGRTYNTEDMTTAQIVLRDKP
jgi:hypothetical protein